MKSQYVYSSGATLWENLKTFSGSSNMWSRHKIFILSVVKGSLFEPTTYDIDDYI